jgi:hypothetical protein
MPVACSCGAELALSDDFRKTLLNDRRRHSLPERLCCGITGAVLLPLTMFLLGKPVVILHTLRYSSEVWLLVLVLLGVGGFVFGAVIGEKFLESLETELETALKKKK